MNSEVIPLLAVTVPVAGIFGLLVGSFLNVVIYRTPLGLSVARPRSFCPTCDRQLEWWENVPLASWVALRGRCHSCHQAISIRYPLVELATGIAFAMVTWAWHGSIVAAAYCVLAAGMISIGLIEFGGQRSPLAVAATAAAIAQVIILVGAGWQHHWPIVFGSLIGSGVAIMIFSAQRTADPECRDSRWHGRSGLLIAGCWLGGLGSTPSAVGVTLGIATYFLCTVAAWSLARQPAGLAPAPAASRAAQPILSAPLLPSLAVALVASLVAGG